MLFAIYALDAPETLNKRMTLRPAHRTYLADIRTRTAFTGPLVADDGETMIGSLMIMDFPDRSAAEARFADEPFNKGGLFSCVCINAYNGAPGPFQPERR